MSRLLLYRIRSGLTKSHTLAKCLHYRIVLGAIEQKNSQCNCFDRTLYLDVEDAIMCGNCGYIIHIGWLIGRGNKHVSLNQIFDKSISRKRNLDIIENALCTAVNYIDIWHRIIIYSISCQSRKRNNIVPAICFAYKSRKNPETDIKRLVRLVAGSYRLLLNHKFLTNVESYTLYKLLKNKK